MLTYKRKLILTNEQTNRINSWIGSCRVVYNLGLEIKIAAYKNNQKNVSCYDLQKQLTEIKHIDWIKDVPAQSLQSSLERLENSYNVFFRGGGFPKYASKKTYKSILFKSISIENNFATLPKIGKLKMVKDAVILGNTKTATIIKEPTGYFICITTDATKNINNNDEKQVVGIDVGVAKFCVLSDGTFVENPKHFKKYERELRIANRSLARKKKGSYAFKKQSKRLAKLHHKIANCRKDFLHKESTKIAKQYHYVSLEELKVVNMTKRAKTKKDENNKFIKNNAAQKTGLNKSILDCGWSMFKIMLEYKTNVIKVNPKYTSQTCNSCGNIDKENRKTQSNFECVNCGHKENADFNAAKNIEGLGRAVVRQREALACT